MVDNNAKPKLPLRWLPAALLTRIEKRYELQQSIANIGWLSVQPMLDLTVGLLIGVWVARKLGPADYGTLSYAIAFVGLFSPLATFGVGITVVRDLVRDPDASSVILGSATFLRALGSAALLAVSCIVIAVLRPEDTMVWLFVGIVALGQAMRNLGTFELWFTAKVQGKYTTWSRSSAVILSAMIKAALILAGAGVMMFVIAYSLEVALTAITMFVIYSTTARMPVSRWRVRYELVGQIFKDSWPLVVAGFMSVVYMKIDQVMIGEMRGEAEVGIYGVAARLSETFHLLPSFIMTSVFPSLVKARKISQELYLSRFQRLYDLFVWLGIVAAFLMQFLARPIVGFLYGEHYIESGPVLAVHIWSGVFWAAGSTGHRYLITENHMRIQLFMSICGALANVALNFFLIPRFGPLGAAYASFASLGVSHWLSGIVFAPSRITVLFFLRAFYLPGLVKRWAKLW
ncbi:MAG: flippase [Deltaproteobacteria bacterium]|nr:flippase [Deltaproteobacteria bacterium]